MIGFSVFLVGIRNYTDMDIVAVTLGFYELARIVVITRFNERQAISHSVRHL